MLKLHLIAASAALGLAGCAGGGLFGDSPTSAAEAEAERETEFGTVESRAYATVQNPAGETIGRVVLSWDGSQIQAVSQLTAMQPGTYAVHIHETGRCDAPDYSSAGGHWNPTNEGHGFEDPEDGWHKGDLLNVTVGIGGTGTSTTMISGAPWAGAANALFDADGAAIVVHERADDYRSDPAGDAGGRRGCGVLMRG